MKKYIAIEEEVLVRLLEGKYVKGSLHRDMWTGIITFKAYNCHTRKRPKDRLVCPLATGWLKEGAKNYKFYSSVKKELGVVQVTEMMHRELEEASKAMVCKKIAEFHEKTIEELLEEV